MVLVYLIHPPTQLILSLIVQIQSELTGKGEEFKSTERKLHLHVSELSEELTTNQRKLDTLKADKERGDKKHETEFSALSSNLATLRQQLQSTKTRLSSTEEMLTQQSAQVKGEIILRC